MKILHIINQLNRSGAENMLLNLSKALKIKNVEQEVIALIPEGGLTQTLTNLSIPVSDLGMTNGLPSIDALWMLKRKIQEYNPDVIIGWMYHSCVAASLASPRSIPVIWGIHHTLSRYGEEKLLTRILIKSGKLFQNRVAKYVYVSEISEQQHVSIGYPSKSLR